MSERAATTAAWERGARVQEKNRKRERWRESDREGQLARHRKGAGPAATAAIAAAIDRNGGVNWLSRSAGKRVNE